MFEGGSQERRMVFCRHAVGTAAAAVSVSIALVEVVAVVTPGPVLRLEPQLGSTAVSSCAIKTHWALCSLRGQSCRSAHGLLVCVHTSVSFLQRLTALYSL